MPAASPPREVALPSSAVRPERIVVLPMLVVGVALLLVAPVPLLGAVGLAATAVALFLPGRFAVTRNEQALLGVAGLSLGIILPRAMAPAELPAGAISDGMYALGMAAQLSALVRLFVARAAYGNRVTCAIGLVALAAAGRGGTPFIFGGFVGLFLATSIAAIAVDDPGRPRWTRLGPRHFAGLILIPLVAAGTVVAAADTLPPLQERILARLMSGWRQTGFSDRLSLGEMRGMAMSTQLVARVRGAPVDHLRGVVFRAYHRGTWNQKGNHPAYILEVETPQPVGDQAVEIELPGRVQVYPAPLGATDLWVSTGVLEAERQGVLKPSRKHESKRVGFRIDPEIAAPGIANDPVQDEDLQVPPPIRTDLQRILAGWGATGLSPEDTVALIRRKLTTEYAYSLEFRRTRRVDAVIDFLEVERRGHCEYFATASTLLARTAGIPARLIGGYLVVERSPLADYAIVRERDAHAWSEVHLGGRWQTLDATPGGPIAAVPVTPWGVAFADLLATQWERFEDWLARRTQLELSLVLASLLVSFVIYRVWRARGEAAVAPRVRLDAPLPAFVRLARALEAAGITPRAPEEPIETWARRVGDGPLDPDAASAAADALRDYAALRYGAPRDEALVLSRMAAVASTVERRDARAASRVTS